MAARLDIFSRPPVPPIAEEGVPIDRGVRTLPEGFIQLEAESEEAESAVSEPLAPNLAPPPDLVAEVENGTDDQENDEDAVVELAAGRLSVELPQREVSFAIPLAPPERTSVTSAIELSAWLEERADRAVRTRQQQQARAAHECLEKRRSMQTAVHDAKARLEAGTMGEKEARRIRGLLAKIEIAEAEGRDARAVVEELDDDVKVALAQALEEQRRAMRLLDERMAARKRAQQAKEDRRAALRAAV